MNKKSNSVPVPTPIRSIHLSPSGSCEKLFIVTSEKDAAHKATLKMKPAEP
jgi:hypothetical protein